MTGYTLSGWLFVLVSIAVIVFCWKGGHRE